MEMEEKETFYYCIEKLTRPSSRCRTGCDPIGGRQQNALVLVETPFFLIDVFPLFCVVFFLFSSCFRFLCLFLLLIRQAHPQKIPPLKTLMEDCGRFVRFFLQFLLFKGLTNSAFFFKEQYSTFPQNSTFFFSLTFPHEKTFAALLQSSNPFVILESVFC